MSRPSSRFSARGGLARSRWGSVEFCHSSGSLSVVDATYFGFVFSARTTAVDVDCQGSARSVSMSRLLHLY
jgi:hypothetical protein